MLPSSIRKPSLSPFPARACPEKLESMVPPLLWNRPPSVIRIPWFPSPLPDWPPVPVKVNWLVPTLTCAPSLRIPKYPPPAPLPWPPVPVSVNDPVCVETVTPGVIARPARPEAALVPAWSPRPVMETVAFPVPVMFPSIRTPVLSWKSPPSPLISIEPPTELICPRTWTPWKSPVALPLSLPARSMIPPRASLMVVPDPTVSCPADPATN